MQINHCMYYYDFNLRKFGQYEIMITYKIAK
jgi:hypothetical protein